MGYNTKLTGGRSLTGLVHVVKFLKPINTKQMLKIKTTAHLLLIANTPAKALEAHRNGRINKNELEQLQRFFQFKSKLKRVTGK